MTVLVGSRVFLPLDAVTIRSSTGAGYTYIGFALNTRSLPPTRANARVGTRDDDLFFYKFSQLNNIGFSSCFLCVPAPFELKIGHAFQHYRIRSGGGQEFPHGLR